MKTIEEVDLDNMILGMHTEENVKMIWEKFHTLKQAFVSIANDSI